MVLYRTQFEMINNDNEDSRETRSFSGHRSAAKMYRERSGLRVVIYGSADDDQQLTQTTVVA